MVLQMSTIRIETIVLMRAHLQKVNSVPSAGSPGCKWKEQYHAYLVLRIYHVCNARAVLVEKFSTFNVADQDVYLIQMHLQYIKGTHVLLMHVSPFVGWPSYN